MTSIGNINILVRSSLKTFQISLPGDAYVRDIIQEINEKKELDYHVDIPKCPCCSPIKSKYKSLDLSKKISYYNKRVMVVTVRNIMMVGGGLAVVWYENGALHVGGPQQRQTYSKPIAEFSIPTFHVSCRSDKYQGQNMIGFVLYLCDNKQLFYLNGMKCRPGYILLVSANKLDNIQTKQGTMHSKAFKYFTNKDLSDMNIVGGGFAVKNGATKFNSGTFNQATTKFHDEKREMHIMEQQCITAAVANWKGACQNTKVSDLAVNGTCISHGFY
eukprot:339949_1